jgi:hypothetical protein
VQKTRRRHEQREAQRTMTNPEKSDFQETPWAPTIDTSSDTEDQETAAADYEAVYGIRPLYSTGSDPGDDPPPPTVPMPDLASAYLSAPDFKPSQSSGSAAGAPPKTSPKTFSINLDTLRTAEDMCLGAAHAAIAEYNSLKSAVSDVIADPNFFGQNVGKWHEGLQGSPTTTPHPGGPRTSGGENGVPGDYGRGMSWKPDPLDSESVSFAESINPQLTKLLEQIAGAVEVMGSFNALLNNAGQMYTEADYSSAYHNPVTPKLPLGHGPVVH